jgi:hypothetical protein
MGLLSEAGSLMQSIKINEAKVIQLISYNHFHFYHTNLCFQRFPNTESQNHLYCVR